MLLDSTQFLWMTLGAPIWGREAALKRFEALYHHAMAGAALEPGLFTKTVPIGGGKTLASLSFALEHAVRHNLPRIVYVIPFTSIIEQTAAVFREASNAFARRAQEPVRRTRIRAAMAS